MNQTKHLCSVQVTKCEHKCFSLQEALYSAQKDSAASSAASVSPQQLLQQLQEAGRALADSHNSAQKLLQQLQEAQQANSNLQQQLTGKLCTPW